MTVRRSLLPCGLGATGTQAMKILTFYARPVAGSICIAVLLQFTITREDGAWVFLKLGAIMPGVQVTRTFIGWKPAWPNWCLHGGKGQELKQTQ